MILTRAKLEHFTAFEALDVEFSPGINVLVGENGTGKTHLMKACYAACDVSITAEEFIHKLTKVFLPSGSRYQRLVKKDRGSPQSDGSVEVFRTQDERIDSVSVSALNPSEQGGYWSTWPPDWSTQSIRSAYIPVKDMLANAPGFRSLYSLRDIHFEEIYFDILNLAYLPPLRKQPNVASENLLYGLAESMGGNVVIKDEEFYLDSKFAGLLEFPLLAEGLRKLGLLWLLIKNGTLQDGSVLFWDEPETNLNPRLFGTVIDALLTLQRHGLQVFLATHDYVILKELDLQATPEDRVAFHSLYRDPETDEIDCRTVDQLQQLHPNAILDTFDSLYDRDVERALAGISTTQ